MDPIPLITAAEMDEMTPNERDAAVRARIVTDLDDLPPHFRDQINASALRHGAERRAARTDS